MRVPVSPNSSRKNQSSGIVPSPSKRRWMPLTVSSIMSAILVAAACHLKAAAHRMRLLTLPEAPQFSLRWMGEACSF